MSKQMKIYSVWVGGSEVNDYYLTYEGAVEIYQEYVDKGYDDAVIRKEIETKDSPSYYNPLQKGRTWESKLIGLTKKEIEKLYKNNLWEKNNNK